MVKKILLIAHTVKYLKWQQVVYQIKNKLFKVKNLEVFKDENLSFFPLTFTRQQALELAYKGEPLKQIYVPDFVCYGKVMIELKALANTVNGHKAQVMNYLKATGLSLGLLVNFGAYPKATVERIVM